MTATRDSWDNQPLPEARARLEVEAAYPRARFERIAAGFVPRAMEQKWFAFLEGDWLQIHRSWTGICVYRVRFAPTPDGARIAEAWVNRDPEQYSAVVSDAQDAATLLQLIDALWR